jgi:hypothetical protein
MDPGPPFGSNLEDSVSDQIMQEQHVHGEFHLTKCQSFGLNLGFGDENGLESFDFDSFLDVGGDEGGGFNTLSGDFGFGEPELET